MNGLLPRCLVLVLALSPAAALADRAPRTTIVSGQPLPVLAAEPTEDGPFVARGGSRLAGRLRRGLLDRLEPSEAEAVRMLPERPADAKTWTRELRGFPAWLIQVRRDATGRLFLYRPCDLGHHHRYHVDRGALVVLGVEAGRESITRVTRPGPEVWEIETGGSSRRFVRQTTRGLFEETGAEGDHDLFMTPARARTLDLVVNRCHGGKRAELEFRELVPPGRR